ncbi:MAG: twin-arginine translocase TatA/TatE family subunit [Phycisphaerales bacterium]|jgi:sec-independent protein translocase protein TatA
MNELLRNMAFISMPGGPEWVVILIIGLLVFGRKLPEVARNLGKSVNEFKKGMKEFQESASDVARDVNQVTSEVASDVKKAAGVDDSSYQEPSTATDYNTGHYDPYGSPASETTSSSSAEPAPTASATDVAGTSPIQETAAKQSQTDSAVEPTSQPS